MIRSDVQKQILKGLEKIWKEYPEQRFTQMLINLCVIPDDFGLWNRRDEETLEIVQKRINLR